MSRGTGPHAPGAAEAIALGDVIGVEDPRASFEDFVDAASAWLFTMALLLTGNNRAEAEDLLQGVLERAYRRWRRICRSGDDPAPYVRKMLVNASVDRWRRMRRWVEEPLGADEASAPAALWPGGSPAGRDESGLVADRDLLVRALAVLPAGQRAVVVLRYFEDLTEAQTAAALGCSVGSVKSQTSRALARLRTLIASPAGEEPDGTASARSAGTGAPAGSADAGREGGVRHGRA